MIQTQRTNDGAYIVSQYGTWVPGRYESPEAAKLACSKNPDALAKLWKESKAEMLTIKEVEALP